MIYIIIDQSHEWGDPCNDNIEFVSTSLEKAEEVWEKYYSNLNTMDNSKWCYSAYLVEYPDGYFLHSHKFNIIKEIDNIGE